MDEVPHYRMDKTAHAIDWITVKGFKSFKVLEQLELSQTNVIVGPNGAGKSNLIAALLFVRAIHQGRLSYFVGKAGGVDRILHFGRSATKQIEFDISFNDQQHQYHISLEASPAGSLFPTTEVVKFWNPVRDATPIEITLDPAKSEAGISQQNAGGQHREAVRIVRERLDNWRLFHFHDTSERSPMKGNSSVYSVHGLEAGGGNLAAILFWLQQNKENSYTRIRQFVQLVAPFFDDFVFRPTDSNPATVRLEWRHLKSDEIFDVSAMSDGMLRFVALATLLLQPSNFMPSTILLDEPELGLHPFSIARVGGLIRKASHHAQIIVATQSSQLLDCFHPNDVLVTNRVKNHTSFERLDASNLASELEEFSLGELWQRNQFGGCP